MATRLDPHGPARLPVSQPKGQGLGRRKVLGEQSSSRQNSDSFDDAQQQHQQQKEKIATSSQKMARGLSQPVYSAGSSRGPMAAHTSQPMTRAQSQPVQAAAQKGRAAPGALSLRPLGLGERHPQSFGERWGRPMLLDEHATRHGPEFGLTATATPELYAQACSDFWQLPITGAKDTKMSMDIVEKQGTQTGKENRLYRFQRSTGILSSVFVHEKTGRVTVCTYFKPRYQHHNQLAEAERYFHAQ